MKARSSSAKPPNSHDADGEIVASLPVPPLTLDATQRAAAAFVGDQMQTPPMVSAVKKDGVPLYKLARKGVEVEREPRLVHIYNFRFSAYEEPLGQFRIACTKGTYVRSLAHELGQKLGCGAHLATLRRIASGKFNVADATPLETTLQLTSTGIGKACDSLPETGGRHSDYSQLCRLRAVISF